MICIVISRIQIVIRALILHQGNIKFTSDHFLIGHEVFILIIKTLKKMKHSILQQICAGYDKNTKKIVHFKKVYKFALD